jgi:starvation-inducible outer membrane lipoprotein
MSKQVCPICKSEVKANPRYPNYVCETCLSTGVEINGKLTQIQDIDVHTTNEVLCIVKGVNCTAKEARFGGVVVQVI